LKSTKRNPAVIDLEIEARTGTLVKKNVHLNVVVHSRNAWNGEINRLGFFITPDDDEIMEYSRNVVNTIKQDNQTAKNIQISRALFEKLNQECIEYQNDPGLTMAGCV
jgi:hypothetical protein